MSNTWSLFGLPDRNINYPKMQFAVFSRNRIGKIVLVVINVQARFSLKSRSKIKIFFFRHFIFQIYFQLLWLDYYSLLSAFPGLNYYFHPKICPQKVDPKRGPEKFFPES